MEVVIELGREDRNLNIFVPILKQDRMGMWSRANLTPGERDDQRAGLTPNIPGWHVAIDRQAKRVRIFHPFYKTEKGDRFVANFKDKRKQDIAIAPPTVYEDLEDSQVLDWLKWAYRMVNDHPDHRMAIKRQGDFPKELAKLVDDERRFDRHVANAHREMAEERALASMKAEAVANAAG